VADVRTIAARAALIAAGASLAYTLFAIERTLAFGRERRAAAARATTSEAPLSVSVIKPLHGDEPELAENLRSFCIQDYPAFDVILGARDAGDPALVTARAIAGEFAGRTRVAHAGSATPRFANPKVDTLAALVPHAHGDVLVFADSDMFVTPDYLRTIVAPLDDPQVGAVTCLYRGRPADTTIASRMGALANHEQFAPSALIARTLMGMRFGFGATIAVRRALFEAIGGLDAIGGHLADDALLCALVVAHGSRVELAGYVVENVVAEPSPGALWRHELRWARTHRALEPAGYAGLFLTYPISLALLALAIAPRRRSAALVLCAALVLRAALARVARDAFEASTERWWLTPLRDLMGMGVWAAAFAGRGVQWSGTQLALDQRGTIVP
jgi:ceramide glucosyltransferase